MRSIMQATCYHGLWKMHLNTYFVRITGIFLCLPVILFMLSYVDSSTFIKGNISFTPLMMRQDEETQRGCVGDDAMSSAAAAERPSSMSTSVVRVDTADQVSLSVPRSEHVDDVIVSSRPRAVCCRMQRLRSRAENIQARTAAVLQLRFGCH